jgi:hypothetical protein
VANAVGLELRMPTAADNLDGRDWRLQENVAVAWDVTYWLTLSPSLEYNQSLAEVDDAQPQNYLEVFIRRHSYCRIIGPSPHGTRPRWISRRITSSFQSVKLQVAKQLNHPPLGFALAIKKPFNSGQVENDQKEFQVNFTVTYYFR